MTFFTFFSIVFFHIFIVCGAFSYYLEWNRTPKHLFRLVLQTKEHTQEMPYYLVSPFIRELFFWPWSVSKTWKACWAIQQRRLKIIIFVSLVVFVTLTIVNMYIASATQDYVLCMLIECTLWTSSSAAMYFLGSKYTNNTDVLSLVGVCIFLIKFLVPGPLAYKAIHDMVLEDLQHIPSQDFHPI